MADEQRFVAVGMQVRYALWPGQTVMCAKVTVSKLYGPHWFLVDIETGRQSELRPYTVGMFEGLR